MNNPEDDHYLKQELLQRIHEDPQLLAWIDTRVMDGMWFWDLENPEHEWLSPGFKALFGYQPEEVPHHSDWWQQHIFKEDLPKVIDNFQKHCADPSHPYDQIIRYRHRDGRTIWVRCRGRAIFDTDGKPVRMLGSHTDVTALIETRQAVQHLAADLAEANSIKELALLSSGIGIWRWDIPSNSIAWDDSMLALYAIPRGEFNDTYQEWARRVHPDDIAQVESDLGTALAAGDFFDTRFRIRWPSGEIRHIRSQGKIFRDDKGNANRMLGCNVDVTVEVRRELELERSNADLERFAYVASHDLKAPMRNIRQLAEWLQEDIGDIIPERNREQLKLLQESLSRMEHLTDDLLNYATAGTNRYPEVMIDSFELVSEIVQLLQPPKGLQIRMTGEFPEFMTLKAPLEQVLRNLIWNAVMHAPADSGNIGVWITIQPDTLTFHVADDGKPISASQQDRIFEMFGKFHSSGSGMGLAIARKIVERQHGTLGLYNFPLFSPFAPDGPRYEKSFHFCWPLKRAN